MKRSFPRISFAGFLVPFLLLPAYSQFLSTSISLRDWNLKDPSLLVVAQVSVMHAKTGDSLLIYVLRDTVPQAPELSNEGKIPKVDGPFFVISDFAYSHVNALGGTFSAFEKEPSSSKAALSDIRDGDRALRMTTDKKDQGFCGLWIHFFNAYNSPLDRAYLNVQSFASLSFWIRGEIGKENLTLKIADAAWLHKDDALTIGTIGEFLPGGRIDTLWQPVVIPLDRIPAGINTTQLASLVFQADSVGQGTIEIKSLALCRDSSTAAPFSRAMPVPRPEKFHNAIWVWNTENICGNRDKESELVKFLVREDFTEVFLGLPYDAKRARQSGSMEVDSVQLGRLLALLHAKGMKVHALFGDKDFALPEWHPFVESTVNNVIRYNRESRPSGRFDGIHLDIEPYLLPGFNGTRRDEILKDYLDLLANVSVQCHKSKLIVGADIPFWYGMPDAFTEEAGTLDFQGVTKLVYEHILDLVDNVTVMSYRTTSAGTDGIINHSLDEIVYAAHQGRRVFIGLETGPLPDERIVTFRGRPSAGFGKTSSGDHLFLLPTTGDSLLAYLLEDRQLEDFAQFAQSGAIDQKKLLHWSSLNSVVVPGKRLSFATLGIDRLKRAMEESTVELGQYSSFGGFAIHYYDSYRILLAQPPR